MVVVALVRALISRGFARDFDGYDLPVFGEGLQRPIDCGNPDGRHFLQREFQDFSRGERVGVIAENGLDGPLLPGVSIHTHH